MDSIPEDNMDKMSIYDNVEANELSTNYFTPIDMDVTLKTLSIFSMDPLDIDVAHINHLSF